MDDELVRVARLTAEARLLGVSFTSTSFLYVDSTYVMICFILADGSLLFVLLCHGVLYTINSFVGSLPFMATNLRYRVAVVFWCCCHGMLYTINFFVGSLPFIATNLHDIVDTAMKHTLIRR